MAHRITPAWNLASLSNQTDSSGKEDSAASSGELLITACRDCGHSHHPPQFYCLYCGSTRVQPVMMPANIQPHPATWLFGKHRTHPKPN